VRFIVILVVLVLGLLVLLGWIAEGQDGGGE